MCRCYTTVVDLLDRLLLVGLARSLPAKEQCLRCTKPLEAGNYQVAEGSKWEIYAPSLPRLPSQASLHRGPPLRATSLAELLADLLAELLGAPRWHRWQLQQSRLLCDPTDGLWVSCGPCRRRLGCCRTPRRAAPRRNQKHYDEVTQLAAAVRRTQVLGRMVQMLLRPPGMRLRQLCPRPVLLPPADEAPNLRSLKKPPGPGEGIMVTVVNRYPMMTRITSLASQIQRRLQIPMALPPPLTAKEIQFLCRSTYHQRLVSVMCHTAGRRQAAKQLVAPRLLARTSTLSLLQLLFQTR